MTRTIALLCVALLPACATTRHHGQAEVGPCAEEKVVLEPGTLHFQFNGVSPDGRTLAVGWERGGAHGAALIDLRTGARTELPPVLDNAVSFSPDGRRLIAAVRTPDRRTEIVELDRASGRTRVIASDPSADFLPSYSRDMRRVYFNSYRTGGSDLYVASTEDGALTRLTTFEGYDAHAQLAPDQTRLAFHRNTADAGYDIVVLTLATGQEQVLASAPGEDAYPAWSPDGRHLVFASDRGGTAGATDLYVMRADGSEVRRLTADSLASYPSFAPDGRAVYFVSKRDGHGVYRLRLDAAGRCEAGRR
jgi:Tol biopolymer transport system component